MINLNYHHLYYFYTVANEGSVIAASDKLNVAQPTISAQLKSLEETLGVPLFVRTGRGLALTEVGKTVLKYAEDIFTIGKEMIQTINAHGPGSVIHVRVGVVDVVSKILVCHALLPVFKSFPKMKIICVDGKPAELISKLSRQELDIVLSDEHLPHGSRVKAFSHILGESSISFLISEKVNTKKLDAFPKCLETHPIILPTENTVIRKTLDHWFHDQNLDIIPMSELEDSVLIKETSCEIGSIFAVPTVVEKQTCERYNCKVLGRATKATLTYYALSLERRVKHPGVALITERAKGELFKSIKDQ